MKKFVTLGGNVLVDGRVGLTMGLGKHHRIDLTTCLPITTSSVIGTIGLSPQDTQLQQDIATYKSLEHITHFV